MTFPSHLPDAKIPVILDTDIGTDIDDTWGLAFLLRCPELDVRLVTTASGDTTERAKIVAKMLEIAGRTDIPIGIGLPLENTRCFQSEWARGYRLDSYPGTVVENGVSAITQAVLRSPEPVTVIAIGPLTNLAAALLYEPAIVEHSTFIGMFGSIRSGYFGKPGSVAEYNVRLFPHACRKVFSSAWKKTIAPLDTSGIVQLKGEKYQAVRQSSDPLARAVMENYDCWKKYYENPLYQGFDPQVESSVLYDLVPVYLAFSENRLNLETLSLAVTDDGETHVAEGGDSIRCATSWSDLPGFEDLVVARLLGQPFKA